MITIGIYSRKFSSQHRNALQLIFSEIESAGGSVILNAKFYESVKKDYKISNFKGTFDTHDELRRSASFLISLGGDGTLLESVTLVKNSGIPIMGINIGRLGFLSSIDVTDIRTAIQALFSGNYSISNRTLLQLSGLSNSELPSVNFAVNDITISKKNSNTMIVIHTWINDIHLNSYWADGLIIATPTGSTAYSLSCSGPIITPDSQNIVITPIAPHNLSVRPVIIPDNSKIKIKVEGRDKFCNLTLDSRTIAIPSGTELHIKKEEFDIQIVTLPSDSFFQVIRDKLMWGSDKRN